MASLEQLSSTPESLQIHIQPIRMHFTFDLATHLRRDIFKAFYVDN